MKDYSHDPGLSFLIHLVFIIAPGMILGVRTTADNGSVGPLVRCTTMKKPVIAAKDTVILNNFPTIYGVDDILTCCTPDWVFSKALSASLLIHRVV